MKAVYYTLVLQTHIAEDQFIQRSGNDFDDFVISIDPWAIDNGLIQAIGPNRLSYLKCNCIVFTIITQIESFCQAFKHSHDNVNVCLISWMQYDPRMTIPKFDNICQCFTGIVNNHRYFNVLN